MEPLLSIREAARYLGVSPQTAARLVRAGDIDAIRVGRRRLLIDPASLRAFIENSSTRATRP